MISGVGGDIDGAIQKAVTLVLTEFEPEGLTNVANIESLG
jgi:hypothetical protein